ncbi:hypothetical protein GKC30_13625 [Pseudodesulfovibrio sp. F-1]|uniref:Uncharacterized protein n=1 Tax=Pseudodesulfovibrio alkaliphilus TaxID=2661613 RepID=A0A7K1KRF3_9BACT|nr:hypothetical protein [Pseudodesulfovibrio alkaliphilus]MUM78675.1 hypothetical protein [Pseudodesulfovibrio alkaliphilus]
MELKLSAESIRIIKKFLKLDTSFSKQHFDAAKDKAKLARVVRWRNAFCERIVKKPHASRKDRRELQAVQR